MVPGVLRLLGRSNLPDSISVQDSSAPFPLSMLLIASLVPKIVKLVGSRSTASFAVESEMLLMTDESCGVTMIPVFSLAKFKYLVSMLPSIPCAGDSLAG